MSTHEENVHGAIEAIARRVAREEIQRFHAMPLPPPPPPPPPADVRQWSGAFLALPGYEAKVVGVSNSPVAYPEKSAPWRADLCGVYRAHGLTHLPLTVMPRGGTTTDAIARLEVFSDELKSSGMVLCHKLLTDNRGDALPNDFATAMNYVRDIVPRFAGEKHHVISLGWEIPDTTHGSGGHDNWGWSGVGEKLLEFLAIVRDLTDQPVYLHYRPAWWGPAIFQDGSGDAHGFAQAFQRAGGTGYLFQSRWGSPDHYTDSNGNPEGVVYHALERLSPHHRPPGVCGRVEHFELDWVWFEFARDWVTQQRRLAFLERDGRGRGFC